MHNQSQGRIINDRKDTGGKETKNDEFNFLLIDYKPAIASQIFQIHMLPSPSTFLSIFPISAPHTFAAKFPCFLYLKRTLMQFAVHFTMGNGSHSQVRFNNKISRIKVIYLKMKRMLSAYWTQSQLNHLNCGYTHICRICSFSFFEISV